MNPGRSPLQKERKESGGKPDKDGAYYGSWVDLALQTALTLAIAVLAGVFGGYWLDGALGTSPLFIIVGVLWGAGGGTVWLIIKVKRFAEARERMEKDNDDPEDT